MEREQIRTVLATKLMGWTLSPNGYWWQDRHGSCVQAEGTWQPDVSWSQCGCMIVEAMRAQGWCWDGSFTDEGNFWCSWWRATDDGDHVYFSGVGDTFPEAVSYVAALAMLEANDEQS